MRLLAAWPVLPLVADARVGTLEKSVCGCLTRREQQH
jgi:hypothetical protein